MYTFFENFIHEYNVFWSDNPPWFSDLCPFLLPTSQLILLLWACLNETIEFFRVAYMSTEGSYLLMCGQLTSEDMTKENESPSSGSPLTVNSSSRTGRALWALSSSVKDVHGSPTLCRYCAGVHTSCEFRQWPEYHSTPPIFWFPSVIFAGLWIV